MFRKLFYLVSAFMVVGLIGPVAAQEVDMEIGFVMQPPVLDGQVDDIWADASTQYFVPLEDPADGSGSWMALYDSENLYVIVDVTDESLQNDSSGSWQDDSVEIYFDGGNTKVSTPLSGDDHQYTFGWTTDEIQGTNVAGYTDGIEHAQVDTDTGWRIEIKLPWLSIWGVAPQAGDLIGIDCYYNDDDDGGDSREGKMLGFSAVEGWNDASQWGTAVLAAEPEPEPVTIPVDPNSDLAAANALANPGDTILFAEGTYDITSQIEVKDGVTYKGAGPGLTIIDGNDATRAFVAWGDRGATNGQVDANGVGVPNHTGQTGWVLEGLTIQNCASDTENRQDILSAARDLLNNYTGTPYTLATAQEENGGITNNPEWFDILSGGADDDLTDAELQAYLDANPVGSEGHLVVNDDKRDDGGAVLILNGADGTIRNCEFSNNTADDDGGAILVDGQALVVAIKNCTFNLNSCGDVGGAVSLSGNNSNSTVTGCSFIDCTADDDGGAIKMEGAGDGGSIYTVTDCTFTGCSASDDGGAIFANADRSSYVWTDCTFTGNYTGDDGAAVKYAPDNADMTVTNCAFIGNGKDPDGTVITDDSVWQTNDDDAGSLTFINCLFADNEVKDDRLVEVKAVFAFQNCTFANNVVGDKTIIAIRGRPWNSTGDVDENGDDIDDVTTDASVVNNCLFINNTTDGDVIGDNRKDDGVFGVTVTNCLFYGNVDLNGTDPADNVRDVIVEVGTIDVSAVTDAAQIVVDPAGDYYLAAGSPAIDASDPATATDADIEGTAAFGVRDVGAYEYVAPQAENVILTFSDLAEGSEDAIAVDYQPSELEGTGITTTWTNMWLFNDDNAGEGLRDHTETWDPGVASIYVFTDDAGGSIGFNSAVEVSSLWIYQDSWAWTSVAGYLGDQEIWSVPAEHPEEWVEVTAGAGHMIDSIVAVGAWSRIDDITIGVGDPN